MKVFLKFSLPEDQEEYNMALYGGDYKLALNEFGEWLRRRYKHASPPSEDAQKEYETIKESFWEFYNTYVKHE